MSATLATNEEGELLNQLLQVKPVTASMIDSYNHTVNYLIPKIIESQRLTTLKGKVITFSNPFFTRPTTIDKNHNNQIVPLYPYEARIRGESYMAKIYVRLTFNESDKYGQLTPIEGQTIETYLGKIPVMIGSELDNLYGLSEKERAQKGEPEKDPQGYFIIHQERTLLNLERLRTNIPLMYEDRGQQVVRYTSKTLTDTTIVVVQEIKNCLDVSFSGMESKQHLNIFIVFFVLGLKQNTVQTTLQIMDSFITDADPARELRRKKELRQYLQETNSAFIEATHQGSPTVIANLVADKFRKMAFIKSADQLIQVEENVRSLLFKNIKYPPTRAGKTDAQFAQDVNGALSAKVRMLAYMCTKFIEFKNGYRELDDRDNWANKMIEDAGRHIEVRFNDILGTVMEMAQKKITKDKIEGIENVEMAIRTNLLGEQFQKSFTRGIWSNFKTQKPVVTVDILNRDTLLATYSQLKKINAPMNGKGMVKEKRMVHLSGWGYISPSSTPEGATCLKWDTPVQMADGSSKQIGQLRDGDWIITVNPTTYEKEPTQIYNHFVRMASAHNQGLFKITTLNGREIIATGDHAFLTQNGWVNAEKLKLGLHKVVFDFENNCSCVGLSQIERLTEDVLVSDFTTVSPHHSMISNGFVTHNCGIVKDSAQTTYLSLDRDDSYIHGLIVPFLKYTVSKDNSNSIFLNGVHLGYINSNYLQKEILTWRRQQRIPFDTGIFTDLMEDLWIYTTGGRMCRPVLIVETDENGFSMPVIDKLKLRGQSIQTLLEKGAMEYIDAAEQQNPRVIIASVKSKINNANSYLLTAYENLKYVNEQIQQIEADTKISESEKIKKRTALEEEKKQFTDAYEKAFSEPKYTHMEIDPTVILGVRTALVPLPESMPGPRVTYQEGMYQQASGANSARDELRYDTTAKRLITAEVPFTAIDMHERLGLDRYPAGMHVILMISTAFGYNQEDAIVMNKASIERGLFKHVIYHSYKVVIASNDEIRPPEKMNAYTSKLNEKGIIRIGETVVPGDMLVSKITKDNSDKKNIVIRDTSLYAEIGKKGVVDDILETMNTEEEGGILIRIRLREVREPIEGDKFASRYAQKGVIGKVVPEVDMPVIVSSDPYLNGVRPDIIFNPLGIPSRMTVPKLLEVILGKIIARTGVRINVTAFRKFNMISFMDKLHDLGMARTGNELFMNAKTGRPMEVQIFTGPVYYQQLRHMVRDKAQARGRGAVQYLTRQPTAGIRRQGAMRMGRMEVTALIEHGSSQLIKERTSTSSDAYRFTICIPCGSFAIVQGLESKVECLLCKNCNPQNFRNITMPYSMKLLTNLLAIANIKVKYVVSP